jgi:acetate kinase
VLVVTVNSGSTSVKLSAWQSAGAPPTLHPLRREQHSGRGLEPRAVLGAFLRTLDAAPLAAVAHRVVHGGTRFAGPVVIDASVEETIRQLSELAPLHNPVALEWIAAARAVCPAEVQQVAAFDTAFYVDLPRVAAEYALPRACGIDLGVRRYGFHGLAHQGMWRRWCELNPRLEQGGRIITLQLGGGCSATAILRGRPVDTSMGFSPLEGLVMATRSGDVDPAVVAFLAGKLHVTPDRVIESLNHESGLLGVSGTSSDLRQLISEPRAEAAEFAVELYCYRAAKYVGAYLAVLGGCDGIVLGGGVGEHMPEVRARILESLAWAGVELDPEANQAAQGSEACISRTSSPVRVQVILGDEERLLADAALASTAARAPAP